MTDFSIELNFLKPNVDFDYEQINTLKTDDYSNLLTSISKYYKVDTNQIELFNGHSSAIYSILKFLNLKYCFIYAPCHLGYKKAASNLDYEVRLINRFENLYLPIKEKSVVIFANPSFLDGTYYDLEKLFEYWISKDATIVIDESLLDFCSESSVVKYIKSYEKLYVLKDYSKYYSNENLNISSIFSNNKNCEFLRKYEPEDKLSTFTMIYLEEALKDREFKLISNSINIKNRNDLEKVLHNHKYVETFFRSSSNSLLVKLKNISSKEFRDKLEKDNIKIADCLKYDFIDDSFLNMYVNSKDDIYKLKEVLDAF